MNRVFLEVASGAWNVTQRKVKRGVVEVWRSPDGVLNINRRSRCLWIPKRHALSDPGSALSVNGVDLGQVDFVNEKGVMRWNDLTPSQLDGIFRPGDEFGPEIELEEESGEDWSLCAYPSEWADDQYWESDIRVFGLNGDGASEVTLEVSEQDNIWRLFEFKYLKYGGMECFQLKRRHLSAVPERVSSVRLMSGGRVRSVLVSPPESPRPTTAEWWQERRVEIPPEQRKDAFDGEHLNHASQGDVGVPEDIHYRGAVPVITKASAMPGGFAVSWAWKEGEGPVDRLDRMGWTTRKTLRPWAVRIWYRSVRLRGSGQPWRASALSDHQRPDGGRVVSIPVSQEVCAPYDYVDVMVQGVTQHVRMLPPSYPVSCMVGGSPAALYEGNLRFSVGMSVFRRFPGVGKPMSVTEYEEWKVEAGKKDNFWTAVKSIEDPVVYLKWRVLEEGQVLTNGEMRELVMEQLPGFGFVTDNFGSFNALPRDLWEEILDHTDTNDLTYDAMWFSCADFATDFKAAAARLGAKALIVWDNAGGHAYIALPVIEKYDGDRLMARLVFVEPQTDGEVEINPDAGQYQQDKGGLVLGW